MPATWPRRLPRARYVELPGEDHLPYVGDSARVVDEIRQFLVNLPDAVPPERALATVLSVRSAAPEFADVIRGELARQRGRELAGADSGSLVAAFEGPARAVRCALTIVGEARERGLAAKAGLHTGEIILARGGVGPAVDIAAAIADFADTHEVVLSSAVRNVVAGSGLRLTERGAHALCGQPEATALYVAGYPG